MENDQQDGDQGRGRLQTENLDATGELPANNNGHETAERSRKSPRSRVENELSLPEKSKPTGGMRGSRRNQEHPLARREFREMPSGTGSTPNGCWSSTGMETKTRPNMTS